MTTEARPLVAAATTSANLEELRANVTAIGRGEDHIPQESKPRRQGCHDWSKQCERTH